MPSEVREKPLPTPHPDYTRSPGSPREGERPFPRAHERTQEFDPEESAYDACADDLDLMLNTPVSEPDPALASDLNTLRSGTRSSGGDVTSSPFLEEQQDQAGTAEVFGAVTSRSDEIAQPQTGWGARIFSRLAGRRARQHSEVSRPADYDGDSHGLGIWMSVDPI